MTEEQAQEEASWDAVLVRIGQAIMLHRAGDREEARRRFALLWAETGEGGDPFHRCTIAHYMADTQEDPLDELAWDRRALAAADTLAAAEALAGEAGAGVADGPGGPGGGRHAGAVRSFYPSLYLSLASDHAKLGERDAARQELRRARGAAGTLSDDAYGAGVRAAIARLETALGVP